MLTVGSRSDALNEVGATSSTTRSRGVGNRTSYRSIETSQPHSLNRAAIHSALSRPYVDPTWCGRALRRRMDAPISEALVSERKVASQAGGAFCASNRIEAAAAAMSKTVTARFIASQLLSSSAPQLLRRSSGQGAELALVADAEFIPRISVALPAEMLEGIGGRHAADAGTHVVRQSERQSLHQPAAECIADAGWIDDAPRSHGRYVGAAVLRDDGGAVFATGHDQRVAALEDFGLAEIRLLPEQLELVIVADHDAGTVDAFREVTALHAGALLTGIEDVANPERPALLGVLHHRTRIVWRDDRQVAAAERPERQLAGVGHRPGIERGDLVVGLIGRAEKRGGELPLDLLHL